MAKKPTFEEGLKELEALVQQIESGQIGLEESIRKYEQGMKLVTHCRTLLTEAEQRILQLQTGAEGRGALPTTEALPTADDVNICPPSSPENPP